MVPIYFDAPKKGLKTEINDKSISDWGKILLNLSKDGLLKRNYQNNKGQNETVFLKNIESILKENKTKAEKYLETLN